MTMWKIVQLVTGLKQYILRRSAACNHYLQPLSVPSKVCSLAAEVCIANQEAK